MPFRASFDCLWCGTSHTVRSAADLEGWAQLCPACIGRAGENEFVRFRVRRALEERAATAPTEPPAAETGDRGDEMRGYYEARAAEYDDWYLRRGRYSHGPIHDAAWNAELDVAGRWLDALAIRGEILEIAAGTGWWSPLLAAKGTLTLTDAVETTLDRARERLLAHGLRAHLHVRDAWAEPDREVDVVFSGFWLSHVRDERLADFLALVRRWLRPGGTYAFIDSLPDPQSGAADHDPVAEGGVSRRRLADGREFTIVKAYRSPTELHASLVEAGFADARVTTSGRFFLLGEATAPTP
jgi:SAM-dependent methyltransferase